MTFESNLENGTIKLFLNPQEKNIIYRALRHYSAFSKDSEHVIDNMPFISKLMNVLDDFSLPE